MLHATNIISIHLISIKFKNLAAFLSISSVNLKHNLSAYFSVKDKKFKIFN